MGFFDIFKTLETAPFLTEPQVQEMERKAQQTNEQMGLISRYMTAYNQDAVGNAEIDLMWRMGKAATHRQVKTIQAETPKTIRATNEAIADKTTKYLETYAQSLINRGGAK